MQIRPATPQDVDMLAQLHVQAWDETYRGLLPDAEIAAHGLAFRRKLWARILARGAGRLMVVPGCGFAQMGSQRDDALRAGGYPEELYCLYTLAAVHGTGIGPALLNAVRGAQPFTAIVLDGNARACRFYEKSGAQWLDTRHDMIGAAPTTERVYGWCAKAH